MNFEFFHMFMVTVTDWEYFWNTLVYSLNIIRITNNKYGVWGKPYENSAPRYSYQTFPLFLVS